MDVLAIQRPIGERPDDAPGAFLLFLPVTNGGGWAALCEPPDSAAGRPAAAAAAAPRWLTHAGYAADPTARIRATPGERVAQTVLRLPEVARATTRVMTRVVTTVPGHPPGWRLPSLAEPRFQQRWLGRTDGFTLAAATAAARGGAAPPAPRWVVHADAAGGRPELRFAEARSTILAEARPRLAKGEEARLATLLDRLLAAFRTMTTGAGGAKADDVVRLTLNPGEAADAIQYDPRAGRAWLRTLVPHGNNDPPWVSLDRLRLAVADGRAVQAPPPRDGGWYWSAAPDFAARPLEELLVAVDREGAPR